MLPKITVKNNNNKKNTLIYHFFRCGYFWVRSHKKVPHFSFAGKRQSIERREPFESNAVRCSRARGQWQLWNKLPPARPAASHSRKSKSAGGHDLSLRGCLLIRDCIRGRHSFVTLRFCHILTFRRPYVSSFRSCLRLLFYR